MRRTKSQYRRLMQVLEMIRAGRQHLDAFAALSSVGGYRRLANCESMAGPLDVCSRTIKRDIDFLRDEIGVPIEYDAQRHGYYLTDPLFRLAGGVMPERTLDELLIAERVLEALGLDSLAQNLALLVEQAFTTGDVKIDEKRAAMASRVSPQAGTPHGIPAAVLEPVLRALSGSRRLLLELSPSASGDPEIFRFDPYRLILGPRGCLVAGMEHGKNRNSTHRTIALDQVAEATLLATTFVEQQEQSTEGSAGIDHEAMHPRTLDPGGESTAQAA